MRKIRKGAVRTNTVSDSFYCRSVFQWTDFCLKGHISVVRCKKEYVIRPSGAKRHRLMQCKTAQVNAAQAQQSGANEQYGVRRYLNEQ